MHTHPLCRISFPPLGRKFVAHNTNCPMRDVVYYCVFLYVDPTLSLPLPSVHVHHHRSGLESFPSTGLGLDHSTDGRTAWRAAAAPPAPCQRFRAGCSNDSECPSRAFPRSVLVSVVTCLSPRWLFEVHVAAKPGYNELWQATSVDDHPTAESPNSADDSTSSPKSLRSDPPSL